MMPRLFTNKDAKHLQTLKWVLVGGTASNTIVSERGHIVQLVYVNGTWKVQHGLEVLVKGRADTVGEAITACNDAAWKLRAQWRNKPKIG